MHRLYRRQKFGAERREPELSPTIGNTVQLVMLQISRETPPDETRATRGSHLQPSSSCPLRPRPADSRYQRSGSRYRSGRQGLSLRQTKRLLRGGTILLSLVAVTVLLVAAGAIIWHSDLLFTPLTRPMASPRPTPTPFPHAGFIWYTDTSHGFVLQYPQDWKVLTLGQSQGTEFDNQADPSAICQILEPAPDSLPSSYRAAALQWVNFELDNLNNNFHDGQYRATHPAIALIGGQVWHMRSVTLQTTTGDILIQVYAMVHNDQPYIINLLTITTKKAPSPIQAYRSFQSMLKSFRFIRLNLVGSPGT